jgi:iron-sulfur cluster assembly protein
MIQITQEAAAEAKRLMDKENLVGYSLRVGVQGGGCSGLSYMLGFDKKVNGTDHVVDGHGIQVVCDFRSQLYLSEAVLEFVQDTRGSGFRVNNPIARATCGGCGSAH